MLQREPLKRGGLYHKTDEKSSENWDIFKKTSALFRYQKRYCICLISLAEAHKIRETGGLSSKFGPVSLLRRAFTCTTADTAMAKTPMCTRNGRIIPKIIRRCQVKKGQKKMFTGIVEILGKVSSVRPGRGGLSLSVDIGRTADGIKLGESIAINGVCLTVTRTTGGLCEFDVSKETQERSTLDKIRTGATVNIERAMSAGGRFGGHIVQGHIDGTAAIKSIDRKGDFAEVVFSADANLLDKMVVKGSVAVDGISLTVARIDKDSFAVSVIPTTLKATTLGSAEAGDKVNIETDIITKAVKKQLEKMLGAKEGITESRLKELGF